MTAAVKSKTVAPLRDVRREFSLAEASYVLGHGEPNEITKLVHETRQIRRDIETRLARDLVTVTYETGSKGTSTHVHQIKHSDESPGKVWVAHDLEPADLRYLKIVSEAFGKELSRTGRKRLYERVRKLPLDEHRLPWGKLVMDITQFDKELGAQIGQLEAIEQKVERKGEGTDPVLAGTSFSVYIIAALTRGQTVDEILEDYPGLTADQVATAVEYEKAHPKIGRPYPSRSLKRGLAALDLSAIDEFLDDGGEKPDAPGE